MFDFGLTLLSVWCLSVRSCCRNSQGGGEPDVGGGMIISTSTTKPAGGGDRDKTVCAKSGVRTDNEIV